MTTLSHPSSTDSRPGALGGILARLAQIVIGFVVQAGILFLSSGRLDWSWAWVYLGIYVVIVSINASVLLRRSPETLAERGRAALTRSWDKLVSGVWTLAQYLLLPLIAALDVRLAWSGEVTYGWHLAGALLFTLGLALFSWAMITNAYFSTAVRIQTDRGHTVCTGGPYRIVRHPGYSGTILQSLGIPLLLGSWWALLPGALAAAAIVIRTAFEDRTLQAELVGYADFVLRVHYRLIPGIW